MTLEGGTPPKMVATFVTNPVLDNSNKTSPAIIIEWTNPNYRLNTGISSHDVLYTIEFDTVGANFTSPDKGEIIVAKELSKTVTIDELNKAMNAMKMAYKVAHDVEFRVVASINNQAKIASNRDTLDNVVNYEDFLVPPPSEEGTGDLWLTGSGVTSNWTNDPTAHANQKFTKVNNGVYTIEYTFAPGGQYKMLSKPGFWQPQYGRKNGDQGQLNGDLGYNLGKPGQSDPSEFLTPDEAGTYRITVNFYTGKYSLEKL